MSVLNGYRVLELGGGMAISLAGMVFADYGAEVVKIDPPGGDWARGLRGYPMWNRGKIKLTLDLANPSDRGDAVKLASNADVLITSLDSDQATRFCLNFAGIARVNPRIVYCSLSGFGDHRFGRPGRSKPKGYESLVAAKTGQWVGLDEVQGLVVERDASEPIFKVVPVNSYAASQLAVQGVLAALLDREDSGQGRHLHTSLVQGGMTMLMRRELSFQRSGLNDQHEALMGGLRLTFLVARCKDDRWIQMCARQDHHFDNWMRALGLENVLQDERYNRGPLRIPSVADVNELAERIRTRMRERSQDDWMTSFVEEYDVGADPVLPPDEFLDHPQVRANDLDATVDDPDLGVVRQLDRIAKVQPIPNGTSYPPLRPLRAASNGFTWAIPAHRVGAVGHECHYRSLPLEGTTILELAYFVAAPLGPTVLAELGARVIKVEPEQGDPWRRTGLGAIHHLHGKESIAIDLKKASSQEVIKRLIEKADVLLTNFRPGVPERLGFGSEHAFAVNPQLVYVYAGSYGKQGPHSHRAAFHSTPNALTGAAIAQAGIGNPPVDDGFPDPCSGLAVGTGILLGLASRRLTGSGQYVETNMLCSTGYAFSGSLTDFANAPPRAVNDANQMGVSALAHLYPCAEGWITLSIFREDEWQALAVTLGHDEWLTDHRFGTESARRLNDGALEAMLAAVFATETAAHWESTLVSADVPAAEASTDGIGQWLLENDWLVRASSAAEGEYWRMRGRINFDDVNPRLAPAPGIGENTTSILAELGFQPEDLTRLREEAVVT